MQSLVGNEVDVVTHLQVALCTSRNREAGNLHVILVFVVYRHLHLDESFLGVDGSRVLSVEYELLNQAFSTDIDAARTVIVGA